MIWVIIISLVAGLLFFVADLSLSRGRVFWSYQSAIFGAICAAVIVFFITSIIYAIDYSIDKDSQREIKCTELGGVVNKDALCIKDGVAVPYKNGSFTNP